MKDASDEASEGEPRLLRFWIDAQLPPSLAVWLRGEQGADATHFQDLDLLTAGDPVIFAEAARNGAVVVTKDGDFPKLVEERGMSATGAQDLAFPSRTLKCPPAP